MGCNKDVTSEAALWECAIRRCCEDGFHTGLAPYGSLPQPIMECQVLNNLGLEGHAPDSWGFIEEAETVKEDSGLTVISLSEFWEEVGNLLLGVTGHECEPQEGFEPETLGDSFSVVKTTRDKSETCPFWDDCTADCVGLSIPDNEVECLLLGRHPLFVPLEGDDVALQVTFVPDGPVFDVIDLRPAAV